MNNQLKNAIKYWKHVAPIVDIPKNKKQYMALSKNLDELLDIVGNDELHPLMGLVDVMSYAISVYDDRHYTLGVHGVDALKFLMEQHHLKQTDLSTIASQGVISEVLNGKRQLSLNMIIKLSNFFGVDSQVFIDDSAHDH